MRAVDLALSFIAIAIEGEGKGEPKPQKPYLASLLVGRHHNSPQVSAVVAQQLAKHNAIGANVHTLMYSKAICVEIKE